MPGLRSLARRVRGGWRALRFRLWVTRLRFELARRGARLALDAPHGAELERLPIVRVHPAGAGAGTLTLRIGQGVRFGRNVALELWAHGTNRLELGDYAHVYDGARLGLYSGSISLGHHSSIRYNAILKSAGELRVGNEVFVSHGSVVHCDARVALGDRSGLAEGVTIVDSDHPLDGTDEHFYPTTPRRSRGPRGERLRCLSCGDNTWRPRGAQRCRGRRRGGEARRLSVGLAGRWRPCYRR